MTSQVMSPVQVKPGQPGPATTKTPVVDRLVISLDNGVDHVSRHVCHAVADASSSAIAARGAFTIAVGAEGAPFLTALESVFEERGMNPQFDRWHVLLTDERFATGNHNESTQKALKETILQQVPSSQFYGLNEDVLLNDTNSLASTYEATIQLVLSQKSANMLDMALLGFAKDGQIGCLFPNNYLLKENEKLVGTVSDIPNEDVKFGITMTLPIFDFMSRQVLFCATGADKGPLLRTIFKEVDPDEAATYPVSKGKVFKVTREDGGVQEFDTASYPCTMVNNPNATWIVDMEAVKAAKEAPAPY